MSYNNYGKLMFSPSYILMLIHRSWDSYTTVIAISADFQAFTNTCVHKSPRLQKPHVTGLPETMYQEIGTALPEMVDVFKTWAKCVVVTHLRVNDCWVHSHQPSTL